MYPAPPVTRIVICLFLSIGGRSRPTDVTDTESDEGDPLGIRGEDLLGGLLGRLPRSRRPPVGSGPPSGVADRPGWFRAPQVSRDSVDAPPYPRMIQVLPSISSRAASRCPAWQAVSVIT